MERAAHPSSGRRAAIGGVGSLVVSGAALVVLLVLWAVASREPRGPNTPGDGFVLALISALGLAGAGLVLAVVVRSRLLPRRNSLGTWFAVGCALVVVQLLLSCLAWWLITIDSVFISCDQRPLLPGLYVVGQALGMAGAGWSVRLAGSAAGRWSRGAARAAGIVGAGVLVVGIPSFAFVISVVESACPP
jgi:hypothetical protein